MVTALPRVSMGNQEYFRDDRLEEFRAVNNPCDCITFEEVRQTYLTLRTNLEYLFRGSSDATGGLPTIEMNNKRYFRDDKLREFRAVNNSHDCVSFEQVRQVYLEAIAKIEDLFTTCPEQF